MSVKHEHNNEEVFQGMLDEATSGSFSEDNNENTTPSLTSDSQLTDNYEPEEEKNRSRSISTILRYYGESYKNKIDFQRRYRKVLTIGCGIITVVFAIALLLVVKYAVKNASELDISGIVTIITAIISLVVSILDLIRTITKYCFPENDEEYIVKIVESIQTNDLEKYKEHNRSNEARGKPSDGK